MAKREDFKTREERVEEGKAIVDLFKDILSSKDLLSELLHDDNDQDDIDPAVKQLLLAQIRQLASQHFTGIKDALECFDNINAHLLGTIWAAEDVGYEVVIADLISNIDFVQAQPFAPWMQSILSRSCSAILDADDDLALEYACGVVNVLGGMANHILGDEYDDVADVMNESEESFQACWELTLKITGSANPFESDDTEPSVSISALPGIKRIQTLDPLGRIEYLSQLLRDAGIPPALLDEETRQFIVEYDEGLIAIYKHLAPAYSGDFAVEPFGAYTDDELLNFFPDLWRNAADISQGEWGVENLLVEITEDGCESTITVRFSACGSEHEWLYRHDSSYADTSWFEDLQAFSKEFLSGRYLVSNDGELSCDFVYLPPSVLNRLEV